MRCSIKTIILIKTAAKIEFLGLQLTIEQFLLFSGILAFLIFCLLLAILLILYLKKRFVIKGYLSYKNQEFHLESSILKIEDQINYIQQYFYKDKERKRK